MTTPPFVNGILFAVVLILAIALALVHDEDFRADQVEPEVDDVRECAACGRFFPPDEMERLDGLWLCEDCAEAYRRIEDLSK